MANGLTLDLTGKTAVVTGSTQGIGLAIARRLAEASADVVINGRNAERVAQAVESLSGLLVRGVAADVTTVEGAQALVDAAGAVDVLVNNLGIFGSRRRSRSMTTSGAGSLW